MTREWARWRWHNCRSSWRADRRLKLRQLQKFQGSPAPSRGAGSDDSSAQVSRVCVADALRMGHGAPETKTNRAAFLEASARRRFHAKIRGSAFRRRGRTGSGKRRASRKTFGELEV